MPTISAPTRSSSEATRPNTDAGSPRAATGESLGAFALTEPRGGSHPADLRTLATRDGATYRIDGVKHFISNADEAAFIVVFAKTDPGAGARGVSAFVVERKSPGLSVSRPERLMGIRGAHAFEVSFDGVAVPESHRLGDEGTGFRTAMKVLDNSRLDVAATATPSAELLAIGLCNTPIAMSPRQPPAPSEVFARTREWARLREFVDSPVDQALLGLVYGRRRQGKTMLLKRLCAEYGGFYWQAQETEAAANLEALSVAYSDWVAGPGPIRFSTWTEAIAALLSPSDRPTPVVLDEVGRIIGRVGELPSILQDRLAHSHSMRANRSRLILCGSAFGQMRRLIDGTAPLRGRATLELVLHPFDFRTAAAFWGLDGNPGAAFEHFAYVGGTPAYPTFAGFDRPTNGNIDRWVCRRLLDPSSALFREGRVVVAEDEELVDQKLYWGLLGAVASGKSRWGDIDALLGAKRGSLSHALRTTIDAGWLLRRDDPLRANRSTYELREPLVRFHRLVIEPHEQQLTVGVEPSKIWTAVEPTVASLILGPELERMAYDWCMLHASATTLGGLCSLVGPTALALEVDDGHGGSVRNLDLAVVERTARGGRRLLAVGEVKAQARRVGKPLLERLDRASTALAVNRRDDIDVAGPIKRIIVSRGGFTNELRREADRRDDVELVDLHRLYGGE